jgi:hypothetical protein
LYFAPTPQIAGKYGPVQKFKITLYKPFVLKLPHWRKYGWVAYVRDNVDISTVMQIHDGIVISEGKTQWREDLRQAVVFPEYKNQIIAV